ncbi:MAG: S49 family peptidase [Zoogloeaceae bacterium]|jgi:protease-4|nr:S49 family peptidase [Zoogloeaceae bacterium]
MSVSDESSSRTSGVWEQKTLETLVFAALKEQRARRRWGVFFKILAFAYLFFLLAVMMGWAGGKNAETSGRHSALIDLHGVIEAEGDIDAEDINEALGAAFKDKNTAGVILRINSPGGSPVQSGMIFDEMRRQKKLHPTIPLHVVIEDLCASGGYYIAAGADKIHVNRASLVGSIGVLMDSFGFTDAMSKLGVERRLMTAGENKGFLDPFSPMRDNQKAHVQGLLDELHQQFIAAVKEGRGARLKETPELFSGLVWSGERSVEMGLADGFNTVAGVARDEIKAEKIVDFSVKENFAERFAKRLGASAMGSLKQAFFGQMREAEHGGALR